VVFDGLNVDENLPIAPDLFKKLKVIHPTGFMSNWTMDGNYQHKRMTDKHTRGFK